MTSLKKTSSKIFSVGIFIAVTIVSFTSFTHSVNAANPWPNGPYVNHAYPYVFSGNGIAAGAEGGPVVINQTNEISADEIVSAYRSAGIVGFDKGKQDAAFALVSEVQLLRNANSSLQATIDQLDARIRRLEAVSPSASVAPTSQAINTTVVEQADMSRVAALEKEVRIQGQTISMMEVNIGSIYAYVDQKIAHVIAPIKKLLKIK